MAPSWVLTSNVIISIIILIIQLYLSKIPIYKYTNT